MKEPIRVLLLTDGTAIKKWVGDIVQFVLDSEAFEVVGVVVNTADNTSRSSFFYRLLRFIDRKLFKARSNPFQVVGLPVEPKDIYRTMPVQKQYSDWMDEACLDFVTAKNPDLILRFGFRILRGDILRIPKLGVWSLHHGDNKINRGGPPAFWEVVKQDPVSGVTLQQITEDLDGGNVIGKAYTKTDLIYFYRNQVNVFETGVRLFQQKLEELAKGEIKPEVQVLDFYSHPLYKNPSNQESFVIFIQFISRILKKGISNLFYEQQWVISHSKTNNNEESVYRFQKLTPPKGIGWADPFPIFWNNKLWLFAEEILGNVGRIVCFEYIEEKRKFDNPKIILQKDYHLSYPFVFKYEEEWYMIPETGQTGKVIIFKAVEFPFSWEEYKIMSNDKNLFDVTPFEHNSKWYCFATERVGNSAAPNDLLQLYKMPEGPLGIWEKHPSSPIRFDVRGGRAAGKVFQKEGRTFRPAQLGAPKYGYAIQFYEILKLDEKSYEERLVETLLPNWSKEILATHTFNEVDGWQFIDYQRMVRKI